MGKRLIITEKPSVAQDIAAALGGFSKKPEYFEADDFVMTWAVGHLLELFNPGDYDKAYRSWSLKNLPIIPDEFQFKPKDGQKSRLKLIQKLGKRKDMDGLINACDAGREGEMIYRRIVAHSKLDAMPQERLWLRSMTKNAINSAFESLRPSSELDSLSEAAYLRAIGDWMIGMNATRALTQRLKNRTERVPWTAGRVQTPTLSIIVSREREVLAHIPRAYWELTATFEAENEKGKHSWVGKYFDAEKAKAKKTGDENPSWIFDEDRMNLLSREITGMKTALAGEKRKKRQQKPPLPLDLTSLQREANRRFSMSAKRTVGAAQRLYERHKLLTYPRTDSRCLPSDYGPEVDKVLARISSGALGSMGEDVSSTDGSDAAKGQNTSRMNYSSLAGQIQKEGPKNLDRILDSTKVTDHFAIIPTGTGPKEELTGDDARIFDVVVRYFLASLMKPAIIAEVDRVTSLAISDGTVATFRKRSKNVEFPGYLDALGGGGGNQEFLPALVPGQDKSEGISVDVEGLEEHAKMTTPPSRYTEGALLRLMETAGQQIDDEELSEAMQGRGLGTPATRAEIIESLVRREYIKRCNKYLMPTAKAMRMIDVIERANVPTLSSPELTGILEFRLKEVELGKIKSDELRQRLIDYTKEVVNALTSYEHDTLYADEPKIGHCPDCGGGVFESQWGYRCEKNIRDSEDCMFMLWKDTSGRYLDRLLATKVLNEKQVQNVPDFVDRSGKRTIEATLNLKKDEEKGVTRLYVDFGGASTQGFDGADEVIEQEGLWPCPVYEGSEIVMTNFRYVTKKLFAKEEKNGPQLPRIVCKREMKPEEVAGFFAEEGATSEFSDFISKRGRPFTGSLFRKPTGRHGFKFPERKPRPKKGDAAPAKGATKKATTKAKSKAKTKTKSKPKTKAAAKKK